jgi:hypothetical protein
METGAESGAPPAQPKLAIAVEPVRDEKDPDAAVTAFMDVSVGDLFDKAKVDFIHGASDSYIVYDAQGTLLYQTDGTIAHQAEATAVCRQVLAIAEAELQGAYARQTRKLAGLALVSSFEAKSTDDVRAPFRPVEAFIEKNGPICRVFTRSRDFIIFLDKSGEVRCEYTNVSAGVSACIDEFERLNQAAATALSPADQLTLKQILGGELAAAFRAGETVASPVEVFSGSRGFIQRRLEAAVTNLYVISSLTFAGILGTMLALSIAFPLIGLVASARLLSVGALGGMIGAFISVLQRSGSLVVTQFAPRTQVISQAIVRLALGIVFGALVVIAVRGNVAFGTFRSEPYALFLLAVAAGFSERLIPDLLTNITKASTSSESSKS